MGIYLNPTSCSKEEWLIRHGIPVSNNFTWAEKPADQCLVCLLDNGMFKAAGVCYSPRELQSFFDPRDCRPHTLYLVPTEKLQKEIPDLDEWLGYGKRGLL